MTENSNHVVPINLSETNGPWRSLTQEWNVQWIKIDIDDDESILQGPYIADISGVHQVWRIYDDLNNAFVLSIWPARQVDGDEVSFENTRLAGNAPRSLGIAVPSRLYFERSSEKPLNGLRFAVKDSIHLKGVGTSCCNRAYSRLYPALTVTCSSITKLVELGAQVVGKVHLCSLIMKEEPPEAIDYSSPFNPRGDGYQVSSIINEMEQR